MNSGRTLVNGSDLYIGNSSNGLIQLGTKSDFDQCFQSVSEGKAMIAAAVTDKGVQTAADATFQQIATNIGQINVYTGYWYDVTVVDNAGSPVPSTSIYCQTNGQTYVTDPNGRITQIISTSSPNLSFTWTNVIKEWVAADGSLKQRRTTTNIYTGIIHGTANMPVSGSLSTTVQTSVQYGEYRIDKSLTNTYIKSSITIGNKEYYVIHSNSTGVYIMLRYWEKDITFGSSVYYAGSNASSECVAWYNSMIPSLWKDLNAFVNTTVENVNGPCFLISIDIMRMADFFDSNSDYEFCYNGGSKSHSWWGSSQANRDSVWVFDVVDTSYGDYPGESHGFRPILILNNSLFGALD